MALASRLAGAQADIVHGNNILINQIPWQSYQVASFSGRLFFWGSSWSAKALANRLIYTNYNLGTAFMNLRITAGASLGFAMASSYW